MTKHWKVTTKSGNVYDVDLDNGFAHFNSSSIRIWNFKSIPTEALATLTWLSLSELPDSDIPVVGERMYISGKDEWQISSVVASFEEQQ